MLPLEVDMEGTDIVHRDFSHYIHDIQAGIVLTSPPDIASNDEYIGRFCLEKEQQINFEKLIRWCRQQSTGLPITFLLGFYVSLVVKRWWEQYSKLPWPDTIAIYLKVGG